MFQLECRASRSHNTFFNLTTGDTILPTATNIQSFSIGGVKMRGTLTLPSFEDRLFFYIFASICQPVYQLINEHCRKLRELWVCLQVLIVRKDSEKKEGTLQERASDLFSLSRESMNNLLYISLLKHILNI